jgi:DNA-binding response OmpR family regulator
MTDYIKNDVPPIKAKVLIVDDDELIRESLSQILESYEFEVATAANVKDALKLIASRVFDVLVSDLHMPGAGDGLTVVSAMRHSNPAAVTVIFSGFPEMKEAAAAILLQADEILVKPMAPAELIHTIRARLTRGRATPPTAAENVATILEQSAQSTIDDWLLRVEREPGVIGVSLGAAERCAHLHQLFRDLVFRLRNPLPLGTRALVSASAASHVSLAF